MSDNVIEFPDLNDKILYSMDSVLNALTCQGVAIGKDHLGFFIETGGDIVHFESRELLAKFLWHAAYFLDSEKKFIGADEFPALNYDD